MPERLRFLLVLAAYVLAIAAAGGGFMLLVYLAADHLATNWEG